MQHTNFEKGPMIGSGAFGKVYMCCDSLTGELFAVKEVVIGCKMEKEIQAIMNEIKILSDIRHERIIQYSGCQQGDKVLSIFLEYMPGKSLWQHIHDFGAMSENVTKRFTRQILEGLVFLHSEKIIHRDIKVEPDQEAYSEDTLCEENNTMISQAAPEQKDDDGNDNYDEHLHVTNVPQDRHNQGKSYNDKTCEEHTQITHLLQSMTQRGNGDGQEKCREHIIYNEVDNGNSEKGVTECIKFLKPNEITFLLMGGAGNGKSATGDTIIGKQVFQKTASTSSSSDAIFTKYFVYIGDKVVTVIDGPGVNTELSPEDIIKSSIMSVKNALELCDFNFSVLLIVLKYGSRFTKQEREHIKIIKGILGEDVIKKYGICIVTHGDNFDADFEDENIQFIEWCRQQKGDIQNLFEECSYRCVLFNNRTKDETMKSFQVSQVLQFASTLKHFSLDDFMAAFQGMQKLKLEYELPRIIEETNEFIKQKRKEMGNVKLSNDKSKKSQTYEVIRNEVEQYEQELTEKYVDTELIKQPLQLIKIAVMELNSKINNLGVGERYPGVASASGNKSHYQALESHALKDGLLDQGEVSDSYDKREHTSTSFTDTQVRQSMYDQRSSFPVGRELQPSASPNTYGYLPTAQGRQSMYSQRSSFPVGRELQPSASQNTYGYLPTAQVTHDYSQKPFEKIDRSFESSYGDLSATILQDINDFEEEIKSMNHHKIQSKYKWHQLYNKLQKYEKEKKEFIQSLSPDIQKVIDERFNYVRGAIMKHIKLGFKLYLSLAKMWDTITFSYFN